MTKKTATFRWRDETTHYQLSAPDSTATAEKFPGLFGFHFTFVSGAGGFLCSAASGLGVITITAALVRFAEIRRNSGAPEAMNVTIAVYGRDLVLATAYFHLGHSVQFEVAQLPSILCLHIDE